MQLKIEELSFRYGRKRPEVLSNVTLDFDEGGVVGLLGPNGAGKSTLLYLIAGLLTPTRGEVCFNGIAPRLRKPETLSSIYLVAEEAQLPRMSLEEFINLYSCFYPEFDHEVMQMALNEFEMHSPARLDAISMGQKKKILLSFAFACKTPVLLLDEPTNGLDIPGKAAFRRLVAKLASDDRLFLISTHQVRDIDTILDKVLLMNEHQFILNSSIVRLQDKLRFISGAPSIPGGTIYSQPAIGGFDYIAPNVAKEETEVNLELLFEAALKNPEGLKHTLNQ